MVDAGFWKNGKFERKFTPEEMDNLDQNDFGSHANKSVKSKKTLTVDQSKKN